MTPVTPAEDPTLHHLTGGYIVIRTAEADEDNGWDAAVVVCASLDAWPQPNGYAQHPFHEDDSMFFQRAILGLHLRNLVVALEEDLAFVSPHVEALVDEAKVLLGWAPRSASEAHDA